MKHILDRLRARVRNRRFERDLREELRAHEAMKREALEADGVPPDEARQAARRAMGNATLMREEARAVWIAPWLESVLQDVRYAVRMLGRQPLHTLTAGTVLVLAIGLNAALFTLFKALAMDPWPVRDPGSVVRMWARTNGRPVGPSVDEYRFMRDQVKSLSGLAAHAPIYPASLRGAHLPEVSVRASWATANFFDVLGVRTQIGGAFVAEDDVPGNTRAPLVLADSAWRNHFNRDPAIVGRAVFVGGKPFTIVGVLEPKFDGNGREVDVWMPLSALSAVRPSAGLAWDPSTASAACCVAAVGRLAPGISTRQAAQELQMLHERFATDRKKNPGRLLLFGTAEMSGPGSQKFALLGSFAAAIALILVLACANVGNLQLARGLARRREIATRLSIGANRRRIVRQFLTEGFVLASAAGAFAVVIATTLPRLVFWVVDDDIPPYILSRLAPDFQVMLFIFVVCVASCLAFALAPALHATRVRIPLGMLDRASTRPARFQLRSVLLATQIAACTVLLAGAGLVTRAIAHAMTLDPGFKVEGVEMVSVSYPSGTSSKQRQTLELQTLQLVESGDAAVALAYPAPMNDTPLVMSMALPDRPLSEFESVLTRQVSRRYFEMLGIPLIRGRMFTSPTATEAVVNEAFVRMYWPDRDPIGRPARDVDRKGRLQRTYTIVGVVRDTYLTGLEKIDPVIFTPARYGLFLTRGGPSAVEQIRTTVLGINAQVTVTRRPLTDSVRDYLEESRIGAGFAWALGLLGLVLATVGVFGVFAYSVEERRREIGVRLALGAAGGQIVRMLVSASGRAMIAGLGLGLVFSLACGPLLRSYLFGLNPLDPLAYGMVLGLLASAAAVATFVPARRACRVDPAITLRED